MNENSAHKKSICLTKSLPNFSTNAVFQDISDKFRKETAITTEKAIDTFDERYVLTKIWMDDSRFAEKCYCWPERLKSDLKRNEIGDAHYRMII